MMHAVFATLCFATPPSATEVSRLPDPKQLASLHALLASEPHVAGTPGDARTIERLSDAMRSFGIDADGKPMDGFSVAVEQFFPLLSRPVKAKLEIVAPAELLPQGAATNGARRGVLALGVTEPNLAIDPATAHPDLDIAWNAWSGSGVAEAGVVYVNYGRREDFLELAKLGIDPRGKIALARYGGNFRGYKAKFAEEAGCVGLVIFTDPADSGFARGKTWPDGGGWANAECIQRGSLGTLPYAGDPLTPGVYASEHATRLTIDEVKLPKIPVQPIGYGAAQQILVRMKGIDAPKEWCGALPCPYRLSDDALKLRIEVEQVRAITPTANVVARLVGAKYPNEEVIIGAHHDAWCFGAADPLAGTICMLECARNFCELAKRGVRPDRTLVFCAWGAEEYGIYGSSEFVERDRERLSANAVAYINLDMSAMGLKPGASVSPTLRASVAKALAQAPAVGGEGVALSIWPKNPDDAPSFGDLGGGSDHVGFWCHAGVPSVSLSTGGSEGTSYHSNYDTVAWYRATVGEDYNAARLVTAITNAMVAEFADARETDVSLAELARDAVRQASALVELAKSRNLPLGAIEAVRDAFAQCTALAEEADERIEKLPRDGDRDALRRCTRMWMRDEGIPGRPWFRNLYAATHRHSGYATASWPMLREAIEDADTADPRTAAKLAEAALPYLAIAQEFRALSGVLAVR
ncbi:MAG: M28 family peptidase [Limnohabitans sp.]|nr:M28 family peptidase [Limnohabitans sp.]